jgi:hypothetical protein
MFRGRRAAFLNAFSCLQVFAKRALFLAALQKVQRIKREAVPCESVQAQANVFSCKQLRVDLLMLGGPFSVHVHAKKME